MKPIFLTYKGQRKSLAEWALEFDIPQERLRGRLRRRWSVTKALTAPILERNYAPINKVRRGTFRGELSDVPARSWMTGL